MRQSPLAADIERFTVQAVEEEIPDRANEVLPERLRPARGDRPLDTQIDFSPSRQDRVKALADRRKRRVSLWHPKDRLPPDMDRGFVDHEQQRNGATRDLGAFIFGFTPEDDE